VLTFSCTTPAQYVVPSPLPEGPLVYNGPNGPVPIPELYQAVLREDANLVESLLKEGADPNELCPCGTSPLEAAVAQKKNPNIAELLLAHGANVNARTRPNTQGSTNDWTPVFYAVYYKRTDLVALLLKHGAKVNIVGVEGKSPLDWAKERNATDVVRQLKDAGAKDQISESEKLAEMAISHPTPRYPDRARHDHLSGTGIFELQVRAETGEVTAVSVLSSTGHSILDSAAIQTLKRWRFRPHIVNRVKIPITFSRSDG
jgi:TonB family protein